jgi:hypothetical protein
LFGFYFIDTKPVHTSTVGLDVDLESEIVDYIILSRSCHTYCISFYEHGSGFSEQCSILNDIPYEKTILPYEQKIYTLSEIEIIKDINLLLNHYDNIFIN